MLITPLGNIEISIDGKPVHYKERRIPLNSLCENLNGRYAIVLDFLPDGKEHMIACRILSYHSSKEDEIETGERLELKSFYHGKIKLSIGMEGDTGYYSDGTRDSMYDYDNGYLPDGVQYEILPFTKTTRFVFAIAWLNYCTEDNDIQTWFGADPTIISLQ